MPRLKSITIENFRSIGEVPVTIRFPENKPVILLGENNSGKSNIVRAIELLFGEFHPKYKKLDDYDHYQRNPHNRIVTTILSRWI
jgi:putative ATP-dependent endonuclease of OLD family